MSRLWLAALLFAFTRKNEIKHQLCVQDTDYFPADYRQSRQRFRAAIAAKAHLLKEKLEPFPVANREGDDLTIDHALFGGDGDRLLVVQSGIHGAEAPTGAAVQFMLIEKHLEQLLRRKIDVYLIHALNPWGFRHDRRTDEANINLNRNFCIDGSVFRSDCPEYVRYRSLFEPTHPVSSDWADSFTGEVKFLANLVAAGFDSRGLVDGLDSGQYQFPEGLNYGGKAPAVQTSFLRGQLARLLRRHYRKTLFLDFHTGLGKSGRLAIIKGKRPAAALMAELARLLDREKNIEIRSAESPGFFATSGDVIDFVPALAQEPERVLAVTMEYGTLGASLLSQLRTAQRLILENQSHFRGCGSHRVRDAVRRNFSELFNPSDPLWRRQVLEAANRVFLQLAAHY